jgi:hypothetical protein
MRQFACNVSQASPATALGLGDGGLLHLVRDQFAGSAGAEMAVAFPRGTDRAPSGRASPVGDLFPDAVTLELGERGAVVTTGGRLMLG